MLETLIKRGRGRPPKDGVAKDFKTLASNLLVPGVFSRVEYPRHLKGDPVGLATRYQLEWVSVTINGVFQSCVSEIEALTKRPLSSSEVYYLTKQAADFVGTRFRI